MKKIIALIILGVLFLSVISASMLIPNNDNARENSLAPEHSPVITIGEGGNWWLDRVDFIHYKDGTYDVKPSSLGKPVKTEICYKLMGVKWANFPVSYIINPTNQQGLTEEFVTSAISTSAETWDAESSRELFNNAYAVDYSAKYGMQDYQNAITFGNYQQSGVIGVTSVWYTKVGKQIIEFDIILDTDFQWGDATTNHLAMDLQNIATHELGHAVGLSDLYTNTCNAVTMYGYSTEGETSKRTLERADKLGLQKMYGI